MRASSEVLAARCHDGPRARYSDSQALMLKSRRSYVLTGQLPLIRCVGKELSVLRRICSLEALLVDLQRPDLRLQSGSCFLRPVDIFAGKNPAEAAGVAYALPLSQESLCKTPSRYSLFQE